MTIHPDRLVEWTPLYGGRVPIVPDPECIWSDGGISGYCTEFYKDGVEIGNIVNPLGTCIDVGFGAERLDMHASTSQIVDQPAVDRAEADIAHFRLLTQAIDIVEQPAQLRSGEIGVEQQPGLGAEQLLVSIGLQALAHLGRAPVLPDDRVVKRCPGPAIPDDRRLALISNADRGNVGGIKSGIGDRLAHSIDDGLPDFGSVMLIFTSICSCDSE